MQLAQELEIDRRVQASLADLSTPTDALRIEIDRHAARIAAVIRLYTEWADAGQPSSQPE